MKYISLYISLLVITFLLGACNKDNEINAGDDHRPEIVLDNADGIYTVKVGHELTISPTLKYAKDAEITWTLDGRVVSREASFTRVWDKEGSFYPVITVANDYGQASEELRVDVTALTPPVISLNIPEGGLKLLTNTDYTFRPSIQHADLPDFKIEWMVNGSLAGTDSIFTFRTDIPGIYEMKVIASNIDGSSERSFTAEVTDAKTGTVEFPKPYLTAESTTRYTFSGRAVYLRPEITGFDNPTLKWIVNSDTVACTERIFAFTPQEPGQYTVEVAVSDAASGTESEPGDGVVQGATTVTAEVTVMCVEATPEERRRPATAASSPYADNVLEYAPAPGQFIGNPITGGMTTELTTFDAAAQWALERIGANKLVSLGGFGGYIIVGFDHSITSGGNDYDFAITANAFNSDEGGSNEPGIVWVMQDVNGNGLPDDEWYELKGSDTDAESTIHYYAVTYYRPGGPRLNVGWTDSEGDEGSIRFLSISPQDSYFPAWIPSDSYTLRGTRLAARNSHNTATGYWNNPAYGWGYADNMGSDCLTGGDQSDGAGQRNGFKISNAVNPDGTPARLEYIDFIKVQTGVNAQSGPLGELSTEVARFEDL